MKLIELRYQEAKLRINEIRETVSKLEEQLFLYTYTPVPEEDDFLREHEVAFTEDLNQRLMLLNENIWSVIIDLATGDEDAVKEGD